MHKSLRTLLPFTLRRPAALALATMIAVPSLQAAVLTWDITPGTVGAGNGSITGGAGTWDTNLGNWTTDDGATNVAWVNNTTPDNAIFGDVAGTVTLSTGIRANTLTFNTAGYTITGNTLTLAGTAPTINANANATISSIIAGTTGLTKVGTGVLTLSGVNTYTGGTTINAGTLVVNADNNLGGTGASNPINIDGGTLSTGTANVTLNANHPLNIGPAGGTINGSVANLVNFSGLAANKLLGSGTLTITGNGSTNTVLQISGAQTLFTGDIHIDSARINLNNSASTLGSGAVTIAGGSASLYASATVNLANQFTIQSNGGENRGAIRLSGGGTLSGPIILAGNASIHSDGTGTTTTLSNNITGAFAFGIGNQTAGNATNKYILTGTNTQTSTTAFGILNINADAALGVADGKLTLNSGSTLQAGAATVALNASREIALPGATTFDTNGNSMSVAGPISGAGSLTKSKAGTLTLSGVHSYTGTTTVAGGTLALDYTTNDSSKLSDTSELVLAGGTLRLNGGTHSEIVGFTTVSGGSSIVSTGAAPIQLGFLVRNEGGSLDFSASGIATVDAANDASGILGAWATINGRNWAVNSGNGTITAYSGYTDVPLGGTIANGAATNIRLFGGTNGNVTLGATVTDINTLAHNQPVATTIDVASKTLRLGAVGGILAPEGTGALTIGTAPNSGTLTAGGNMVDQPGEISIMTNSVNAFTINSVIANNGAGGVSLAKSGTGTLVLAGTNTYTGATAINAGTLEIGGTGSLGSNYAASIANNGTLLYSTSVSTTLSGVIAGTGNVIKMGASTLTLTGDNSYSGGTTLAGGRLNVNSATALGTGALTITGGTLDNTADAAITVTRNNAQNWNGDFTFTGTQSLNLGTGAVAMNANRTVTVEAGTLSVGGISGTDFSLTKMGTGTLALTGTGTYTGGTTINEGMLQVSAPAALHTTGIVAVNSGGTLSLASNGSNTYANAFSGTGRILLNTTGSGDTRLSGVSTGFTGILELAGNGGNKLNAGGLQIGAAATIKINSGGQLFTAGTSLANPIQVIGTGNTENRGGIRLNGATVLSGPVTLLGDTTIGGEGASITGTITGTAAAATTQLLTLGTTNSSTGGTYNGIISDGSGGGKLAVTIATGTNNLGGLNTYSGATTVTGTSTLNLTGSIPHSALSMGAGTTLRGEGTASSFTTTGAMNLTIDPSTPGAFTSTGALTLGGTVTVSLGGGAIPLAPVTVLNHGGTTATTANFTLANSSNYRAPAFTVGAENVTLALGNTSLTWTGTGGSNWNVNSTANWKDAGATAQKFFFGDAVTFDDTPGIAQMVTLANAAQTGGITVHNNSVAYSIVANGSNIIASGSLLKTGTGVLTMEGNVANTFAGGATIQEGTIKIQHGGSLGTGRITLQGGGTLAADADNLTLGNLMTLNGGTIDTTNRIVTNTTTFNGIISGSGGVTIASTGDTSATGGGKTGLGVRFNAENTFTGDITVTSGLFSYQTNASLGNPANKIILKGGGLLDNGTGVNMTHEVHVGEQGGLFRTYGSTSATLSGALTGAGDFRHTDGGKLILSGDLSGFTGIYDNQGGTTVVTGEKALGGSWAISAGTLRYEAAGAQTWENPVSGNGILEVASGTLTLKGDSTYSGATNVTGGTLILSGSVEGTLQVNARGGEIRLGGSDRINDFATLNLSGGTFNTGGFSETLGSLHLTANSTIDFGNGASLLAFEIGSILEPGMTLTIANWSGSETGKGTDQLIFAEDMSAWLNQFSFIGYTGAAQIDHTALGGGYEIVAVPEPASVALLGAAIGLLGFRRGRRSRR